MLIAGACQKAPELTLTSPARVELSADGSSGSITFIANRDWRVNCPDGWVSVSPSSGSASKDPVTVSVRCNANTTYDDRTATVTITMEDLSQVVTVKQPANLGVVLPTQSFDLQADAKSLEVEVQANVQYTVSISADWIKQVGTKALTSKTLTFSIAENKTYNAREGKISIKPQQGNEPEKVITVRQAQKDALNVEKTSYDIPYGGGGIEIKVEANVAFDVKPNAEWIHYTQTKALSSSTVSLTVDENQTYSSREGKVEIVQQGGALKHSIAIKQAGRIAVATVELNVTSLTIELGASKSLVATVKPDNATDKTVTWSSSNADIASVDASGKVTAIKEGSATITARAGEKTAECKVSVYVAVTSVELSKTSLSLMEGETAALTATVMPDNATDKTVTWSSSNEKLAKVENGSVTALKVGTATITAQAGGKTAECIVTVNPVPVTSVSLDKTNMELTEGETAVLTATVKPDNATNKTVTWTSSDESIARVDADGKVTAIKAGEAVITAKAGEKKATCALVVKSAFVPITGLQIESVSKEIEEGKSIQLKVVITPDNATDKTVVWTSSNAEYLTVDQNGLVTAVVRNDTSEFKLASIKVCTPSGEVSATCSFTIIKPGIPDNIDQFGGEEQQW